MVVRERLSGSKTGQRYYVCQNWPKCRNQKGYAEQGKELGKWGLVGRVLSRSNK
ncbi:hypothetical protein KJB30_07520 [Geobacter chapellei]|uniref:DNA topoisomerase type IA zn finger domain-containing protein n=2 Tax=Pelotalea chapellei TaxID=44671 RepID=A0ABS5U7H6_9BACT|nr:hypothetical protein [Pelotalea chapellei]